MGPAGPGGPASPLAPVSPVSPLAPGWPSAPCRTGRQGQSGGLSTTLGGRSGPPGGGRRGRRTHRGASKSSRTGRAGLAAVTLGKRDGREQRETSRGRPPRPPRSGHPRQGHVRGWGTLTGAPRAPVGPAGPGGPASPWKRGGKTKKKGSGLWRGGGGGCLDTSVPAGRPYLVTGSTSGAGGADGTGQASETVLARSAISTFGTGVTLGEGHEGGLQGQAPCGGSPLSALRHPWLFILAGTGWDHPPPPPPPQESWALTEGLSPRDGDRGDTEHPLPRTLLSHIQPRGDDEGSTGMVGNR